MNQNNNNPHNPNKRPDQVYVDWVFNLNGVGVILAAALLRITKRV